MKYWKGKSAHGSIIVLGLSSALVCLATIANTQEYLNPPKFERAKRTMSKMYPEAKKTDWRVDSHGFHESHFKLDEKKYRADFKPDGTWVETERSIDWKALPKAVQNAIESEYDKSDINEIEWVHHHSKGKHYDVEFKKSGNKFDVEFNALGEKISK